MRARKFGRVISISSINGQKGQFGRSIIRRPGRRHRLHQGVGAGERQRRHHRQRRSAPAISIPEMVQAVPKDVLEKSVIPQIPVNRLRRAPGRLARAVVFLAADDAGLHHRFDAQRDGGQYQA